MRITLRLGFVALLTLVVIGAFWSHLQTGPKKTTASTKSVTLVVDFGPASGKPSIVRSLLGLDSNLSGWALFKSAGIEVAGTSQYPEGFVCRIDGWPSPKVEDCKQTPSSNVGHWSYYVTNPQLGPGWVLSGQGAATHLPLCGAYEGWSWIPGSGPSKPPRTIPLVRKCDVG